MVLAYTKSEPKNETKKPKFVLNTKTRGFQQIFLHANDPKRRYEFSLIIALLEEREIKNMMGVLNRLIYVIGIKEGFVTKKKVVRGRKVDTEYDINRKRLNKCVKQGVDYVQCTIVGISYHLKRYWKGFSATTVKAVRRVRDFLHDMGLLNAREMVKGCTTPSEFRNIDLGGLMVLYEMLEEALLKFHKMPFEKLPSHKGFFMKLLYNRAAHTLGKFFRRKHKPGVIGVDKFQCDILKPDRSQEGNIAPNDVTYTDPKRQYKPKIPVTSNDVTFVGMDRSVEEDSRTRQSWDDAPEVVLITDEWGNTPELLDSWEYAF